MHACLSQPESGFHRVALCSQIPFCPCVLNVESAATRYSAGTFEVQGPNGQVESLLVIAVYLQARDEAAAQQQASEIVAAAVSTGLRYVLIGDFNLEQHQAALGFAIQSGGTHACDSCASAGNLPNTGPGRKRRIDFALSHWRLPAASVRHRECYFSDHLVVKTIFCLVPLWLSPVHVAKSSRLVPPSKLRSSFRLARLKRLLMPLIMPI